MTEPKARPVPGVVADDGVALHVEIRGVTGPTVVLCHGFTVDSGEWDHQVAALAGRARVVVWDQRGHGRSGWGAPSHATVDQTGRDLAAVLDAVAPSGPVVLAGHSMGGMSILALAHRRPAWFGTRVAGVFLVATSAGDLVRTGVPGALHRAARAAGLMPAVLAGARLAAPIADRLPWRGSRLGRRLARRLMFTAEDADADVAAAQAQTESLPLPVGSAFGASLLAYDETAALPVLARVPTTVVVADADRVTPAEHGKRISDALGPATRFVRVPAAAHAVNQTHPDVVDDELLRLVDRVTPSSACRHAG